MVWQLVKEGKQEGRGEREDDEWSRREKRERESDDSLLRCVVLLSSDESVRVLNVVLVLFSELVVRHLASDVEHPPPPDERVLDGQPDSLGRDDAAKTGQPFRLFFLHRLEPGS